MNRGALRVLRKVSKTGELSLHDSLQVGRGTYGDHRDQYPLSLLIEEGYLGCTQRYIPPAGAEEMREYSMAVMLHMFTMPKETNGTVRYLGIVSSGTVDPKEVRVFMKAKGALYLDALAAKRRDRQYAFVIAVIVGVLTGTFTAWLKTRF